MTEMPFEKEFDAALGNFNRYAVDKLKRGFVNFMKEALSTSTDLFFRRNIGERAFTGVSFAYGILYWLGAAVLSSFLTHWVMVVLTRSAFLRTLSWSVPLFTGLAVLFTFGVLAKQNEKAMKVIRDSKKPYHSRSRGQRRFPNTPAVLLRKLLFVAALFLLSPVVGIAFVASMTTSAELQAEQQRRLMNEYWDKRDNEVTEDFLESSLVGDTPPEITQLYEALPEESDRETREAIARANVGKPIRIVATPPRSAAKRKAAAKAAPLSSPLEDEESATATEPEPTENHVTLPSEIPSANGGKGWKRNILLIVAFIAATALFMAALNYKRASAALFQASNTGGKPAAASLQAHSEALQVTTQPKPDPPVSTVSSVHNHISISQRASDSTLQQTNAASRAPTSAAALIDVATSKVESTKPIDLSQLNISNYSRILLQVRSNTISIIATHKPEWTRKLDETDKEIKALGYFARRKLQPQLGNCIANLKSVLDQHRDFVAYIDEQLEMNSTRSQLSDAELRRYIDALKERDSEAGSARGLFNYTLTQLRWQSQPKGSPYDPAR